MEKQSDEKRTDVDDFKRFLLDVILEKDIGKASNSKTDDIEAAVWVRVREEVQKECHSKDEFFNPISMRRPEYCSNGTPEQWEKIKKEQSDSEREQEYFLVSGNVDHGKEITIECVLFPAAKAYQKIITYILNQMLSKVGRIEDLISKEIRESIFRDWHLKNKTILMEQYAQNFLSKNNLPSAERLIELSAQKYEGSESEARIYIDNENINQKNKICTFSMTGKGDRNLNNNSLRPIRKLMEISKRNKLQLLVDQNLDITGLIVVDEKEDTEINENSTYICFLGYMKWSIYVNGKEEVCYREGKYFVNSSLEKDMYDAKVEEFERRLSKEKPNVHDTIYKIVQELVRILKEQKHGTIVILTDDISEAKRLCNMNRGILIDEFEEQNFYSSDNWLYRTIVSDIINVSDVLEEIVQNNIDFDADKLLSITGIDGALFMDLNGKCTALGVIVDGEALVKGDSGRGARYNSINNYILQKGSKNIYVALIFSEDGGVDIVDNFDASVETCDTCGKVKEVTHR